MLREREKCFGVVGQRRIEEIVQFRFRLLHGCPARPIARKAADDCTLDRIGGVVLREAGRTHSRSHRALLSVPFGDLSVPFGNAIEQALALRVQFA